MTCLVTHFIYFHLQIYFLIPTRALQRYPLLTFLQKIPNDCSNLMSLGTRSHIFGPRNDSLPCLAEFTLRLCNVSSRRKLYRRETGTNIFKMGGERPCKAF